MSRLVVVGVLWLAEVDGLGELDGEGVLHVVGLVVHVVDGAVGAEGVVSEAHARVGRLVGKVQCQEEVCRVDELRDAVEDPGAQEHVPVLDGRHVDEHQGRRPAHPG